MSKSCPNVDCHNVVLYTEDEDLTICPDCKTPLVEIDLTEQDLEDEDNENEEEDNDDEEDEFDDGHKFDYFD